MGNAQKQTIPVRTVTSSSTVNQSPLVAIATPAPSTPAPSVLISSGMASIPASATYSCSIPTNSIPVSLSVGRILNEVGQPPQTFSITGGPFYIASDWIDATKGSVSVHLGAPTNFQIYAGRGPTTATKGDSATGTTMVLLPAGNIYKIVSDLMAANSSPILVNVSGAMFSAFNLVSANPLVLTQVAPPTAEHFSMAGGSSLWTGNMFILFILIVCVALYVAYYNSWMPFARPHSLAT